MTVLKGLAEIVGRLAHLIAPAPEPEPPLTEDDVRSDLFRRRHPACG